MAFKLKNSAPIRRVDMEDGVLGKANRDGTIDINKNIKDPKQEEEVIKHEELHLDQMQRGDLDYDDKNVYWKGKTYPRSKMKEGAKNLPWEKEVYDETKDDNKMNTNFKLKGSRGQSEPMSALANRGLIKKDTMKVRIKPSKEGELSDYAKDHTTKINRRGKVTIEVPKAEMWDKKSKLFNTDYESFTDKKGKSYYKSNDPAGQSTAKGFKKARRRDRLANTGAMLVGSLLVGSQIAGGIKGAKR
tara:strand:+ start:423 stop:1157 length:735 start_codon:yes stop_codon:yes gene_type:complete